MVELIADMPCLPEMMALVGQGEVERERNRITAPRAEGRFDLNATGVQIAGPVDKSGELLMHVEEATDGILQGRPATGLEGTVCFSFPPVRGFHAGKQLAMPPTVGH